MSNHIVRANDKIRLVDQSSEIVAKTKTEKSFENFSRPNLK
jgi:hypothetical protein